VPCEGPAAVHESELETIYGYPDSLGRPYVRLNFVASANGKVAVDGHSAGLGSKADKLVFGHLRRLADVIVVGAGTARADHYRGARSSEVLRAERRERGQAEVAPIAVVTASADLDAEGPLFADASIPPLVLTVKAAPAAKIRRLAAAGAEVLIVGEERAEVPRLIDALASRGLTRILCEGGPSLFGDLITADAVDELCLTISPCLGGTGQISTATPDGTHAMRLESVLVDDGVLLLRYLRDR
jgi:5-amino-6-(5-phosphoribosylamino)uracil reductase